MPGVGGCFLLAFAFLGALGCDRATHSTRGSAPSAGLPPRPAERETRAESAPNANPEKDAQIRPPKRRLVLTPDDAARMQQVLHNYFVVNNKPGTGWYEDREYLINSSRGSAELDEDGNVQIGLWHLDISKEPLALRAVRSGPEDSEFRVVYVAELAFDDAWHIKSFEHEVAHRRH